MIYMKPKQGVMLHKPIFYIKHQVQQVWAAQVYIVRTGYSNGQNDATQKNVPSKSQYKQTNKQTNSRQVGLCLKHCLFEILQI